jgi:hypothetical protein
MLFFHDFLLILRYIFFHSSRLMSTSDEDSASEKTVKEVVFGRNPPKPTGPPKALDITLPVPPSSNARDASYNTLPQATFAANSLISSRPLSPFTSPRTTTSTSTPPDDRQSSFRGLRDVNHGIYCIYHINSGAGVYKAILTL